MSDIEARVDKLEYRADKTDEHLNKMDDGHQRIWQRLDAHRDMQVETKAKLEEVGKDVTELNIQMGKLVDSQNNFIASFNKELFSIRTSASSKWEQFFSKGFWLLIGAVISLIFIKLR